MIDHRTADLMERDLDGSLSAEEGRELERRLQADPEARALHAEMVEVTGHLRAAGDVAVPAGLRGHVLAEAARRRAPSAQGRGTGSRRGWWLAPAPGLRYGAALAAGVALGLGMAAWLLAWPPAGPGLDLDALAGTMAGPDRREAVLEALEVSLPGVEGRGELRPTPAGYLLEPILRAEGSVEVRLLFDADEVDIRGFLDPEGDPAPFRVDRGELSWAHRGSRRYAVILAGRTTGEASLALEFSASGRRLGGGTLRLPGALADPGGA